MRSSVSRVRPRTRLFPTLATLGACLGWCLGLCIASLPAHAQSAADTPTESDIAAAIQTLEADPNLSQERKTRTLRWVRRDTPPPAEQRGSFARWIGNFFVWLGQLSRALVWVVGGLLALALAWFVVRMFKAAGPLAGAEKVIVPTHVRDLDIRPESLPDDIGAAALALWRRGEQRGALALLYRGLLSRLVHVHAVPIRDSSTEGDCLILACRQLPLERREYVAQLIGTWQRATYGARHPSDAEVQAFCAGFDAALAGAPPPGARAA